MKSEILNKANRITSLERRRAGLIASKVRCEENISTWIDQLRKKVEDAGQQLVLEMEAIYKQHEEKALKMELCLSRNTCDLDKLLDSETAVERDIERLLKTNQDNLSEI